VTIPGLRKVVWATSGGESSSDDPSYFFRFCFFLVFCFFLLLSELGFEDFRVLRSRASVFFFDFILALDVAFGPTLLVATVWGKRGSRLDADEIWPGPQFRGCFSDLRPNRRGPTWTPIHSLGKSGRNSRVIDRCAHCTLASFEITLIT
jgi:hypothetical protein